MHRVFLRVLSLSFFAPSLAYAQLFQDIDDVVDKLCIVFGWIFRLAIIFAILYALVAAFKYITAQGSPEKIEETHHSLIYIVIGVIVAVIARGVPLIVANALGATGVTSCP